MKHESWAYQIVEAPWGVLVWALLGLALLALSASGCSGATVPDLPTDAGACAVRAPDAGPGPCAPRLELTPDSGVLLCPPLGPALDLRGAPGCDGGGK